MGSATSPPLGEGFAAMLRRSVSLCLLTALATLTAVFAPAQQVFNRHQVVLDAQGKLLSWSQPQEQAYDRVMRLAWDFLLHTVPVESNGLKTYLTYCCFDEKRLRATRDWPHDPASTFAAFVDSALAYYAYSGDRNVITAVQQMIDYHLQHGVTPANWDWAEVPYASSDAGAREYIGGNDVVYCPQIGEKGACGTGDGHYVIEPDKAGELGMGFLRFYELTCESRYRNAAIACAEALARHVRTGDFEHSPWPFRVYAENNKVREEYSSNVIGSVRLFDELTRLSLGNVAEYSQARLKAWTWMMAYPMQNDRWIAYFEDVPILSLSQERLNFNQYSPMETARYILLHPEYDPAWRTHVAHLIRLVERRFAVDVPDATVAYPFIPLTMTRKMKAPAEPGTQWGANAISEQIEDMNKMGSHTSRYASVNALWYEVTRDNAAKEKAFRSFNWASYMCRRNGVVNVGPVDQSIWFIDGYGDYIRHFMAGLGSVPEWAPPRENHLLRSSSIVQSVSYLPDEVNYKTFDAAASQVLRLDFTPRRVLADGQELPKRADRGEVGWTFDPHHGVLQVRYENSHVIHVLGH